MVYIYEYFATFISMVTGNIGNFRYSPIHLLVRYIELTANNKIEARESKAVYSTVLKHFKLDVLCHVSHVKT